MIANIAPRLRTVPLHSLNLVYLLLWIFFYEFPSIAWSLPQGYLLALELLPTFLPIISAVGQRILTLPGRSLLLPFQADPSVKRSTLKTFRELSCAQRILGLVIRPTFKLNLWEASTLSDLLDKPWSQGRYLLPHPSVL